MLSLAALCLSPTTRSVLASSYVAEALGSVPSDDFNVSTHCWQCFKYTTCVNSFSLFNNPIRLPVELQSALHLLICVFHYFTDITGSEHICHSHPLFKEEGEAQ